MSAFAVRGFNLLDPTCPSSSRSYLLAPLVTNHSFASRFCCHSNKLARFHFDFKLKRASLFWQIVDVKLIQIIFSDDQSDDAEVTYTVHEVRDVLKISHNTWHIFDPL